MNTTFLDACRGRQPEHTPVWFMRQAGRYLPSYLRLKQNRPVTEIAKDPDLASELVADAVRTLGVDAGIIFADIMSPLESLGVDFVIEESVGPVVRNPVRSFEDARTLREFDPSQLHYVYEGIDAALAKLDGAVPLIGFSGAPFTLAGYIIEGRPSRELEKTKMLMHRQPDAWQELMGKLTRMATKYLLQQTKHGVHAVQLFDSWVGCLSPLDYAKYVLPYTTEIFDSLAGKVPRIHFCANSSALIELFWRSGPDVLSVDWRVRIDEVWKRCGDRVGAQGNLDPIIAVCGGDVMSEGVDDILAASKGRAGHIFSLGHGVLRETPPENLQRLVSSVHSKTRRRG